MNQPEKSTRKPYEAPRLIVYGDIAQITENITNMGMTSDNPAMKT